MTHIDDIWDRLRTDGDLSGGYVRLRVPTVTACALYAARNVDSGASALMMEVATASLPGNAELPRSTGFEVSASVVVPGRNGRTRLILDLLDPRYGDVFRSLCADLTDRMTTAADEPAAAQLLVSRLARWQSFLRDHGPEGLSLEARRGLAGELLLLRDELLPRMGNAAVRSWMGWSRANHDFQLDGASIEVKTTAANTPHSFRVSNAGQLDNSSTPILYLCLTAVSESENNGETLPEIVEVVLTLLGTAAQDEFNDRLLQTGFIPAHFPLYTTPRYGLRWRTFYEVVEGFPRLTETDLPGGVEDVKYAVAVSACAPFKIEAPAVFNRLTTSTERSA